MLNKSKSIRVTEIEHIPQRRHGSPLQSVDREVTCPYCGARGTSKA
jgi:hypothetical protein